MPSAPPAKAPPRFTSFVMFAEMRTGSNYLEANLNTLDGVSCLGELYNPQFIGKKGATALFGMDIAARDRDPMAMLQKMRSETKGLAGFRYFHDHNPQVVQPLLQDPRCAKIILSRNPIDSYVSWKIAQATGQWKLTNAKNLKTAQVQFDGPEFEAYLQRLQTFQLHLLHALQVSGQTAFYLDYDDIQDLAVLNGLAAFLGVTARFEALDTTLVKQNPEGLAEKVINYSEMEQTLARLDRFNLSRTPNFEPRRSANVPSYVAGRELGLLYMPMRGGPEASVTDWLSDLAGGVEIDFIRKTLRHWKRDHPQHRSFTVVRHPLLRAHVAFHSQIVSGLARAHRQHLIRVLKADLPPAGEAFHDVAQEQTAFMTFLRFAKLSVGGQTDLKVEPHWASQSAVLQGFGIVQVPDLVLREDRLAAGLAYLAAELGVAAPAPAADTAAEAALRRIWDPAMETAAQEAYGRDYEAFGFTRWQS